MQNTEKKWEGPALMPMLAYDDAAAAIDWYVAAFGAVETARLVGPDGGIGFASIQIGEAVIAVSNVFPGFSTTPAALGGCSVVLNLKVADVDAFFACALAAGAKELIPVADQFYGERAGRLQDPYGHVWIVATAVEELSAEEMQRRFGEMTSGE